MSTDGAGDGEKAPDVSDRQAAPADAPRMRWPRLARPIVVGVVATIALAALVVALARPALYRQAWDATGFGCGRGASLGDPEDVDTPWQTWGEADHEDVSAEATRAYRSDMESLADALELDLVGEIPLDGLAYDDAVTRQGDHLRVRFEGADDSGVALIDPSDGSVRWHLESDGDVWAQQQADLVVVGARSGSATSEDEQATTLISLDAATGEREGCRRVDGWPAYGRGPQNSALLSEVAPADVMRGDDEQPDVGARRLRQVTLPDFSEGFERTIPSVESENEAGTVRTRARPTAIRGDSFLLYDHPFTDVGIRGALRGEGRSGHAPVQAFSLESGDLVWEYGDPGDSVAVVDSPISGSDLPDGATLIAELSAAPDATGSSSVTVRMLDGAGDEVWSATGAEMGDGFPVADADRYVRVLDDLVLLYTDSHELTAFDRASGEERWSIDESAEGRPLFLDTAFSIDGKVYLEGVNGQYLIDEVTGEDSPQAAEALAPATGWGATDVGDDFVLVEAGPYGFVILRRP